jgi:hypothetical protein
MIRFSNRTQAKPTTEMIVSITDQVLMVCPTLIPKYSLTSQNPASLTCEKNSDPPFAGIYMRAVRRRSGRAAG